MIVVVVVDMVVVVVKFIAAVVELTVVENECRFLLLIRSSLLRCRIMCVYSVTTIWVCGSFVDILRMRR